MYSSPSSTAQTMPSPVASNERTAASAFVVMTDRWIVARTSKFGRTRLMKLRGADLASCRPPTGDEPLSASSRTIARISCAVSAPIT